MSILRIREPSRTAFRTPPLTPPTPRTNAVLWFQANPAHPVTLPRVAPPPLVFMSNAASSSLKSRLKYQADVVSQVPFQVNTPRGVWWLPVLLPLYAGTNSKNVSRDWSLT